MKTQHLTQQDWDSIREEHSKMSKEEAYNWLVKAGIIRPNVRKLEGEEAEQVMTMLRLLEPAVTTNNQHSWTEDYLVGDLHYEVHSFEDGTKIIEEIKRNDI